MEVRGALELEGLDPNSGELPLHSSPHPAPPPPRDLSREKFLLPACFVNIIFPNGVMDCSGPCKTLAWRLVR